MSDKAVPGFGTVGSEVKKAIRDDYDIKILITSHNSKPGLGKTTLAIQMAHAWDPHGWSADEKAFMNAHEFHNKYMEADPGSVLLFDEIENEADNRRAMSGKNVGLTQMLATQRFRNLVSIYTLPTASMLDSRMLELADYWINVMKRGVAHPHKLYVNDYTGEVYRVWIGKPDDGGEGERITWEDVERGTQAYRDKQHLDRMKREHAHIEQEHIPKSEHDRLVEKAEEQAQRETRDEWITTIMNTNEGTVGNVGAADIANLPIVEVSRPRVHQIAND